MIGWGARQSQLNYLCMAHESSVMVWRAAKSKRIDHCRCAVIFGFINSASALACAAVASLGKRGANI